MAQPANPVLRWAAVANEKRGLIYPILALAMVLVIGSFAILYGILLIGFSLRLRRHAEVRI